MRWVMVTGSYPPQPGGVSDYGRLLAKGLAESGDEVHVWTSACSAATPEESGVVVHRLPGNFGPLSLARMHAGVRRLPRPYQLLIQYVPHAFGWKATNLPFCLWLLSRRGDGVWTMFHEVVFPFARHQPLSHSVLAAVTRLMAAVVIRSSRRIFVAIPAWEPIIHRLAGDAPNIIWLPIPSTIATEIALDARFATRMTRGLPIDAAVIGHFGTYSEHVTAMLESPLAILLRSDGRRRALLLGRGGESFASAFVQRHPDLRERLLAPGAMPAEQTAAHLASCDVLLQPYPDGASGRRTTLMAGLALGMPIVTTEGLLSEPLWKSSAAVRLVQVGSPTAMVSAVEALLGDCASREALGVRAARLYAERFALEHTVRALRGDVVVAEAV